MPTSASVGVIVSVVACIVASGLFFRKGSGTQKPVFQPKGAAFVIWYVLFALGIAHGVALASNGGGGGVVTASWLYAAAFALSTAWAPSYSMRWYKACAALLVAAWGAALASVATLDGAEMAWAERTFVYRVGPGMLFGWLTLAAALSLVLAGYERLDRQESLLAASAVVTIVAIVFRQPYACLPVLWACALHDGIPQAAAISAALATLGALGAGARL
jgi:hypothetical protein